MSMKNYVNFDSLHLTPEGFSVKPFFKTADRILFFLDLEIRKNFKSLNNAIT